MQLHIVIIENSQECNRQDNVSEWVCVVCETKKQKKKKKQKVSNALTLLFWRQDKFRSPPSADFCRLDALLLCPPSN